MSPVGCYGLAARLFPDSFRRRRHGPAEGCSLRPQFLDAELRVVGWLVMRLKVVRVRVDPRSADGMW